MFAVQEGVAHHALGATGANSVRCRVAAGPRLTITKTVRHTVPTIAKMVQHTVLTITTTVRDMWCRPRALSVCHNYTGHNHFSHEKSSYGLYSYGTSSARCGVAPWALSVEQAGPEWQVAKPDGGSEQPD